MDALLLVLALLMAGAQEDMPDTAAATEVRLSAPEPVGQEDEGDPEDNTSGSVAAVPYPPVEASLTRATRPVSVYAYDRHYEPPKSDEEARYEAGIENGRAQRENQNHNLEGAWQVYDANNVPQVHFIFRAAGTSGNRQIEGAWRLEGPGAGVGRSGFVDSVIEAAGELEISFFSANAPAPLILHLRRSGDGLWRGTLMAPDGKASAITLAPVR